jgi:alkanesulfonate monooxygenase SsuD/methylene tetrahydromethanopterin reductase-like flavin-dependent oxidoreductase (luciferase family)
MTDVHLGLIAPNYGPGLKPDNLLEAATTAERAGFDSVWVTDHIAVPKELAPVYGEITEALVTLAYLAARTSSIKLGVSALVVPQRPPLLTLKQVMSVAYLAQGRLMLCVAAGWTEQEFENLGYSMKGRGRRLDTWLDLTQHAFAEAPCDFTYLKGDLSIRNAWLAPGLGGQLPEIWVGGHSPGALKRAARYGVWHPVGRSLDELRGLAAEFKQLRPEGRVILRIGVRFAAEPVDGGRDERGRPALIGPSQWVAERLLEYMGAGCDGFVVNLDNDRPGLGKRIEQFGEEVRPLLHDLMAMNRNTT